MMPAIGCQRHILSRRAGACRPLSSCSSKARRPRLTHPLPCKRSNRAEPSPPRIAIWCRALLCGVFFRASTNLKWCVSYRARTCGVQFGDAPGYRPIPRSSSDGLQVLLAKVALMIVGSCTLRGIDGCTPLYRQPAATTGGHHNDTGTGLKKGWHGPCSQQVV